jgi:dihydrofolate reductase
MAWKNSTRLTGTDDVAALKEGDGGDLVLLGSGELARSLAQAGLVDDYVLLVHPIVLGSGARLFEPGLPVSALELTDTRTSTTGVIIASYRVSSRAGGER